MINGSYCGFDNIYINNLTGVSYDGKESAAIVRNAASQTFMTRLNAMVLSVPVAFRSNGLCRTEDITIFCSLKDGSTIFEGDSPQFGFNQQWNINGTVDNVPKSTKFKSRVAFNPSILDEQVLEVQHNLVVAPNSSVYVC